MENNVIKLENVTKEYYKSNQKIKAVNDLDLSIHRGEFLGIMGMSGSGKTTMINLIAGFDTPSNGRVIVDGLDLSKFTDKQVSEFRNKKIGMIFQHFNLIREINVLQNVLTPFVIANKKSSMAIKRATQLLLQQGLEHRLYHYPTELSGGEQQRVAIARALMNNPEIIIADEPTGNLDKESTETIIQILEELHNNGKTVVIVTHNENILQNVTKMVTMEYGEIKDLREGRKKITIQDDSAN